MGVYALPLAAEVVCVGVLFLFSGMQVLAQYDSTTPQATRTFIDGVLITVGVLYLSYFAIRLFTDVHRVPHSEERGGLARAAPTDRGSGSVPAGSRLDLASGAAESSPTI